MYSNIYIISSSIRSEKKVGVNNQLNQEKKI